ncbi:MAG: protocatechuate 3,4-dioxygenase, alpha subunit [Gaiellales bacterium]|jgi:protocatechuate 3,4-dioxygenase alpha subunit|nr:protocatechuate 3,4-dioxygenase, alpha subunit [Gaiellales bacterium]
MEETPSVISPFQTIGPMWGYALIFEGCDEAVDPGSQGALTVRGRVTDGEGGPIAYPDGLVEVWRGDQWARSRTSPDGSYRVVVRKPEAHVIAGVGTEAPFFNVTLFARGLLRAIQTRVYFPEDAEQHAADPTMQLVPQERRHTLVGRREGDDLVFDVRLQGDGETVFFDA